ncbi:MAG: HAD family hydrolase [Candidatus Gottesmanbacteria bacterium]|nr:HAD family hydrolase [Candidatus Gottesmanbacteria bacterium]
MKDTIRVCIWDFDGTLYKPNPDLFRDVRESEYRAIMKHTGWTREKTIEEFHTLHKVTIQSATAVVSKLCNIPIAAAARESEKYFDRRKYIHRDTRLIGMFGKLKHFRHFIFANGVIAHHKETLELLGIPPSTFEEFVTSETVGVTKPDPAGFVYIMKKTGLPPNAHLMIGDRELVDLVPAKALGMHTCLVWSDTPSAIADVTLPTVYNVATLFA